MLDEAGRPLVAGEAAQLARRQRVPLDRRPVERHGVEFVAVSFVRAAQDLERVREVVGELLKIDSRDEAKGVVTLSVRPEVVERWRDTAVEQAKKTISNRIDTLGLREATVIGRESDLIVEIPGADESAFERIKNIISKTARLDFILYPTPPPLSLRLVLRSVLQIPNKRQNA